MPSIRQKAAAKNSNELDAEPKPLDAALLKLSNTDIWGLPRFLNIAEARKVNFPNDFDKT